jgi:hypothetical protein
MLKRLALVGLLLAAIWGAVPIPGQTPDHGSQSSRNPKDQTANSKTPSKPTITVIEKNCDSERFKDDADCKKAENNESTVAVIKLPPANVTIQSNPRRDCFDWLAYIANIILLIVNIILLIVAIVTLHWFIIQTKAATKAAEAADKNAQAVITSERPWMIPHITQPDDSGIMLPNEKPDGWKLPLQVEFTNGGKSPAILLRGLMEASFVKVATKTAETAPTLILDLPTPRKYDRDPNKFVPGHILMPEKPIPMCTGIEKAELMSYWKKILDSGQEWCLCVKGFIEYGDTFGETRITRFCYAYQETAEIRAVYKHFTEQSDRPREFRKCGPNTYNEIE